MKLNQYIPSLSWAGSYDKSLFKGDLTAGLTVGIMLIPQGMAYAMIAGMPPIYGLYASIVPLLIYAFLGTSRQLAIGPVAMISLLIISGISQFASPGTNEFISLAIALAVLAGLIQFFLGVIRMGFLVNFLSHPVISGFTSAAALIIGFSQLKHLMGVDLKGSHYIHEVLLEAISRIGEINSVSLIIGLAGILLILVFRKIHRSIPGPLIIVAIGILITFFLGLHQNGLGILGEVPQGLPSFEMPVLSLEIFSNLFPIALTIALVGFLESIAVAKAIQQKHKDYEVDPNQELIALGLANIGGSFFQSFPTTGGFSRTAVNDQAGAKTGIASLISATVIGLTLLFLTPLFYYLPKAILASVILVAVLGLIDIKEVKYLFKTDKKDLALLIATFFATLILGIESGIFTGVILSLIVVIYQTTRPHIAELGRIPETRFYRNISRFPDLEIKKEILIIRPDAQLFFANSNFFKNWIEKAVEKRGKELRLLILDAESISQIDSTGLHTLEELVEDLKSNEIQTVFAGIKGPLRDKLDHSGFTASLGKVNFFMTIQNAVDHYYYDIDEKHKDYVLQSNS